MSKQRPTLKKLVNSNTLDIEQFQNKVIRPVIKMQHDLIIAVFLDYLATRKIDWDSKTIEQKDKIIHSSITKDSKLNQLYVGIIIGHFTNEELKKYFYHKSEFNRRIKQIILQRLKDNTSQIK